MAERQHRGGLVGPVLLITLGGVLLLNNMGLLRWDVWHSLWRLWPVLLIAAGIEVLFGRQSWLGSLLAAAVVLGTVAGALWLWSGPAAGPAAPVQAIREPVEGATAADITVRFGVGRLHLAAQREPGLLLSGSLSGGAGGSVVRHPDAGRTATLEVRGPEGPLSWPLGGGSREPAWDLQLNADLPTRLEIHTGVGLAELDLAELTLTELELRTGVGRTVVTLPARGRLEADIRGGVGETAVTIPAGMAARIDVRAGLGGTEVSGDFTRQGDVYVSADYAAASHRVDLTVRGGVGKISVRRG